MSAFTVFSSDCILLNNLIDGLGAGQWGRAQPDVLSGWAEPSGPQRKPRQEWEKGRWGVGVGVGGG